MDNILYKKKEADALTHSEKNETWRYEAEILKSNLIIEHAKEVKSLVDIGCAWGQTLKQLVGKIPHLAGIDESLDRLQSLKENNDKIETYQCRSTNLILADNSYDAVLMSHIIHEIKLFGEKGDFVKTLNEIKRVLTNIGKFIIIDHRDPGEGNVVIDAGKQKENFIKFQERFKLREVKSEIDGDFIKLSKRDCHDFVTKIWCLDQGAENLEMNETHTVLSQEELSYDLKENNYEIKVNIAFNPITNLMNFYNIKLVEGNDWGRQLFILAEPF
tara:strand:+ start:1490 stop:2308 length:819 start_codon:yes stop_codon:yes gene_type:complete